MTHSIDGKFIHAVIKAAQAPYIRRLKATEGLIMNVRIDEDDFEKVLSNLHELIKAPLDQKDLDKLLFQKVAAHTTLNTSSLQT